MPLATDLQKPSNPTLVTSTLQTPQVSGIIFGELWICESTVCLWSVGMFSWRYYKLETQCTANACVPTTCREKKRALKRSFLLAPRTPFLGMCRCRLPFKGPWENVIFVCIYLILFFFFFYPNQYIPTQSGEATTRMHLERTLVSYKVCVCIKFCVFTKIWVVLFLRIKSCWVVCNCPAERRIIYLILASSWRLFFMLSLFFFFPFLFINVWLYNNSLDMRDFLFELYITLFLKGYIYFSCISMAIFLSSLSFLSFLLRLVNIVILYEWFSSCM